jgi:hypothetical protein
MLKTRMMSRDKNDFVFAELRLIALVGDSPVLEGAVAMAFAFVSIKVGVFNALIAGVCVKASLA